MFLVDTQYACPLSKTTFSFIVDALNRERNIGFQNADSYVAFVDGDSTDIHSILKHIYNLKKENNAVYVITLLSKDKACSSVVKHLSDSVVDKKISYHDLENLVRTLSRMKPKPLADNIFGDVWEDILKLSQKEHRVLKLLLEGLSQQQIAQKLHLSIKTVSGYKAKAIRRHGARNFNELYMKKLHNGF